MELTALVMRMIGALGAVSLGACAVCAFGAGGDYGGLGSYDGAGGDYGGAGGSYGGLGRPRGLKPSVFSDFVGASAQLGDVGKRPTGAVIAQSSGSSGPERRGRRRPTGAVIAQSSGSSDPGPRGRGSLAVETEREDVREACEEIISRLVARYGAPRTWTAFPVKFLPRTAEPILGYTLYSGGVVKEVVVYESLDASIGSTLDHELTHAFFFYWLDSNFDLCINEGLAQNSEYARRAELRETVYRRYKNGEFVDISELIGRNAYDGALLVYHEGFSVVDFLTARGGSKWFAAFVDDLANGSRDVDSALRRFYGYGSLDAFQRAWKEYIENGQDRRTVAPVY